MNKLTEQLITARAQEIINFLSIGMDLEWSIEYVRNTTTLSAASMELVVALVNETLKHGGAK